MVLSLGAVTARSACPERLKTDSAAHPAACRVRYVEEPRDLARRPRSTSGKGELRLVSEKAALRDDAFTVLFRAHVAAVRGYTRTLVLESEVENIVQATFTTAWQKFESIPGDVPRAWLFGVARMHALNVSRSQRRRAALVEAITDLRPQVATSIGSLPGGIDTESVRRALEQLDDGEREIIQLAVWHEMTSAEIAEVLGIRASAARVRLHRARQHLTGLLGGRGEVEA